MIRLFDICIYIFNWGYAFLFFWILRTFLPLRRPLILKIAAFPFCSQIALMIIYSNDPVNLLGTLLGFTAYLIVFYRGAWIHKMTTLLIFYPALIAINYLTQDMGSRLFFSVTGASGESAEWNHQTLLISTAIYAVSNLFLSLIHI